MEEQLITIETAKLAKEKGYGILATDCAFNYSEENNYKIGFNVWTQEDFDNYKIYPAPTQSLLQKWLREKYKLHICIITDGYWDSNNFKYRIDSKNKNIIIDKVNTVYSFISSSIQGYEEALEAGLLEALKLIG